MNRWVGKVAVVTGASAGVGAEVSVELVKRGMKVVAVARRLEKVQELQSKVAGASGKLVPLKGDVASDEDVKKIFEFVKKTFGTVHVLVNNAGFANFGTFIDGEPSDWRKILDVNVIGLAACSKEAVALMRESGVDDGHIINVNSVVGHYVPEHGSSNIYPPSKFAVTAISETLRNELRAAKTKIRVTNLSPGYIETEFLDVAVRKSSPETKDQISKAIAVLPPLYPKDLADAVVYILSAPPHVQVHELTFTAI